TFKTATDLEAILGALNAAAATGDPGTTVTLIAYLKQLVNILIGSAGVATFPASGAPANAVSLAEVIRKIYDVLGTPGTGSVSSDISATFDVAQEAKDSADLAGGYAQTAVNKIGNPANITLAADVAAVKADSGNTYAIVNSGTFGNSALKTLV